MLRNQLTQFQMLSLLLVLSTKLIGILKTSKSPSNTVRSQRRVRFGGVEYMTLQAPVRQYHTSSLYPNRTFPYRVSSPTKGNHSRFSTNIH